MPTISVAEVEARSGIEKEPGETLAEYLRRVGNRTDMPAEDIEAIVTELQRQQFAGETVAAEDADAPIEAFLEAADDLGDDVGDPDADTADGRDSDDPSDESADDGGEPTAAAPPSASGSAATADDGPEEDPMAFYRSVAVLGVVILLAAGTIGSAVLLGTDLGPGDDGLEAAGDADALGDAANGTEGDSNDDESGGNDSDNAAANGSETNETAANGSESESAEGDGAADDGNASVDGEGGNDTADTGGNETDDGNDSEPIGFDGEVTDDADAENGSDRRNGADRDNDDGDGGNDTDGNDGEPVGFGEDADGTEDNDETEDAGGEDETDDPGVVDSAPEATGSLEVTDRAAPGDHPADEYVELTNVGDAPLDMSGWTVRDREGGAVDTHGIEPLAIPEGFVLEPGTSVRLVTGDGEDTAETIYWGQDRQYWRSAGDVVVVRDADGETVLRHPYGDQT